MMAVLNEEVGIEKKAIAKVAVLANYSGVHAGSRYMDAVKKAGKEVRNEKTAKTALLGIDGLKKVLLSGYIAFTGAKDIKAFENESEAKDWLIA